MKILKLLNKKKIIFILTFLFSLNVFAENEPVDIWNLEKEILKKKSIEKNQNTEGIIQGLETTESSIYKNQSKKKNKTILLDETLNTKDIKIIGLYDPDDYDLDINMWSNSDGQQLKNIFSNLNNLDLSNDASEIMEILMLTNTFYPNKNITEDEFLKFKSDWLMKNSDLDLIEEYLIKNQAINTHPKLTKYLVDQHLSNFDLKKSCEIFLKNTEPINDTYLSKFNIYCLFNLDKKNEAQLVLDLKKELGFKDDYFEKKMNFLFGYSDNINKDISEKSILDFHLAHRVNPKLIFEPNDNTKKLIWKYLSSANLLYNVQNIEVSEFDKILTIEKAVHNKNYPEKDLFEIYKRFQFNINQLLNAENSHKSLTKIEARSLVYQRILLESDVNKKLELLEILKNLFIKSNISEAFDDELKKFLENMNQEDISSKFESFYFTYLQKKESSEKKIKINNDTMHQSKLLNYFNGDYAKPKIEKDVNNFLKKIKKNKKYFFSKKDIIFIESLKSDGVKIAKKYDNLYEVNETEIPTDIQVMINNDEKGAALLRIVEVIGQDDLEKMDEDTLYFIITTLNRLDIDLIRNRILLKVLPLKV
ncbi:MAG: hypothetical protein ACJZ4C_01765 [Candidatus Pelagibacter sp.]|tara:strand:+ start:173 stop:1945 length:1773 start_codon:yes stop_codon:yes gene_type:complete